MAQLWYASKAAEFNPFDEEDSEVDFANLAKEINMDFDKEDTNVK